MNCGRCEGTPATLYVVIAQLHDLKDHIGGPTCDACLLEFFVDVLAEKGIIVPEAMMRSEN